LKLLITGGCGFICSNFIRYMLKNREIVEIVNLDLLTCAGNINNLKDIENDFRYKFIKGDISDKELVEIIFSKYKFDAVINFAAESHVDRSIVDVSDFYQTNIGASSIY
jgi:dTDP-glucose 4,6-dehydratase